MPKVLEILVSLKNFRQASQEEISNFESMFDIELPAEYREFLSKFDGAEPEDNIFRKENELSVERFVSISDIPKEIIHIEGLPGCSLPIAELAGGNYIVMDIRNGSISYWEHELYPPYDIIAPSFRDFIPMIIPHKWPEVHLKPGQDLGGWVDPDFKPEF